MKADSTNSDTCQDGCKGNREASAWHKLSLGGLLAPYWGKHRREEREAVAHRTDTHKI